MKSNPLVPVRLEAEGIEWVRTSLSDGRAFSRRILHHLLATPAATFALLPEDTPVERRAEVHHGGIIEQYHSRSKLDELLGVLLHRESALLVVEDDLAYPSDQYAGSRNLARGVIDDTIVYYRAIQEGDARGVAAFLDEGASGYPLNAFVISDARVDTSSFDRSLTDDLPKRAAIVICSSYDDESYILWFRRSHRYYARMQAHIKAK